MSKPLYRVTRAYSAWSVGHIFTDMPGNVARTLMSRGLIEEFKDEPVKKSVKKAFSAPVDRMIAGAPVTK